MAFRVVRIIVGVGLAGLALAALATRLNDWSDWVVFGGILFTTVGAAVAVHKREYPTKKRTIVRDSDSRW